MVYLEHAGICAKDTKALMNWYVSLFGFKVVYNNSKERPTFILSSGSHSMIEIYPMENEARTKGNKDQGLRHLAFGTDNIEMEYQKLLDKKVEIIQELKTSSSGVKVVFFRDLEGNIIHFVQRPVKLI